MNDKISQTSGGDPQDRSRELLHQQLLRKSESEKRLLLKAYMSAAESGDPASVYALGSWYFWGVEPVVIKNRKRAFPLLRQAALAGVVDAAFAVGVCYRNGYGCRKNDKNALNWYLRAALLGSREAMGELSKIHYRGDIVPKDIIVAKIWMDAANQAVKPIPSQSDN